MTIEGKPIVKWLDDHLEETLLIILLVAITGMTGMQVFMRKVFNSPLSWSEELCRYCFMWSGFIGVAYCVRKRCEIKITTFVSLFPAKIQTLFLLLVDLLCFVMYGWFSYVAFNIVRKTVASGQLSPAIGIPSYFIYLGALLGFLLALFRIVQTTAGDVQEFAATGSPKQSAEAIEEP